MRGLRSATSRIQDTGRRPRCRMLPASRASSTSGGPARHHWLQCTSTPRDLLLLGDRQVVRPLHHGRSSPSPRAAPGDALLQAGADQPGSHRRRRPAPGLRSSQLGQQPWPTCVLDCGLADEAQIHGDLLLMPSPHKAFPAAPRLGAWSACAGCPHWLARRSRMPCVLVQQQLARWRCIASPAATLRGWPAPAGGVPRRKLLVRRAAPTTYLRPGRRYAPALFWSANPASKP